MSPPTVRDAEAADAEAYARARYAALLWVAAGNDRTIARYLRHGWTPDGATKTDTFYGAEVAERRLVRTLSS